MPERPGADLRSGTVSDMGNEALERPAAIPALFEGHDSSPHGEQQWVMASQVTFGDHARTVATSKGLNVLNECEGVEAKWERLREVSDRLGAGGVLKRPMHRGCDQTGTDAERSCVDDRHVGTAQRCCLPQRATVELSSAETCMAQIASVSP